MLKKWLINFNILSDYTIIFIQYIHYTSIPTLYRQYYLPVYLPNLPWRTIAKYLKYHVSFYFTAGTDVFSR